MEHKVDLPIGTFLIRDYYLIANIKEGATVTANSNKLLEALVDKYYAAKKVDPAVYSKTSQIKNLAGFAVVANTSFAFNSAKVEKIFFKKPFEIFTDLNEAIKWAISLVKKTTE